MQFWLANHLVARPKNSKSWRKIFWKKEPAPSPNPKFCSDDRLSQYTQRLLILSTDYGTLKLQGPIIKHVKSNSISQGPGTKFDFLPDPSVWHKIPSNMIRLDEHLLGVKNHAVQVEIIIFTSFYQFLPVNVICQ